MKLELIEIKPRYLPMVYKRIYIGNYTRKDWAGSEPHYIVKCSKHGPYIDYAHGFAEYFSCPECKEKQYK